MKNSVYCMAVFCAFAVPYIAAPAPGLAQETNFTRDENRFVETIEQRYEVGPEGTLTLQAETGSIQVDSRTNGEVEVRIVKRIEGRREDRARRALDEIETVLSRQEDDVHIQVVDKNESFFRRNRVTVEMTVRVPERYNLDLSTVDGSIEIEDIAGTVTASAVDGDIVIEDITGPVTAVTVDGDIEIGPADGPVDAGTTDGDIEIVDVKGSITAHTVDGDVDIDSTRGRVTASTMDGDIEIRNTQGPVTADSVDGNIEILHATGDVITGTADGDIEISHTQGVVTANTADGNIDANTTGGDVDAGTLEGNIHLFDTRGSVEARAARGSIEVYVARGNPDADPDATGDPPLPPGPESPDADPPDTEQPDAGPPEIGSPDSGPPDSGPPDSGLRITDQDPDNRWILATTEGDVTIHLPGDLAASVEAEGSSGGLVLSRLWREDLGHIFSDFRLNQSELGVFFYIQSEASGHINGGGDRIRLKTNSGNIYIRER